MQGSIIEIIEVLPQRLQSVFRNIDINFLSDITEIRLKAQCPLLILLKSGMFSLSVKGNLIELKDGIKVYSDDITYIIDRLTHNSFYAYNDEISNCFVTSFGGHRAGLSGTAVMKNGMVSGLKDINGIYFRVAREHFGCSEQLLECISENKKILNTVISAPPGRGKTTLLRELARRLSSKGLKISIIDERHEIAAMCNGIPSFDIGFCDVLDGFPKAKGIERAIRTLSPDVIIFDEIGSLEEAEAVTFALGCGVKYITSVHAYDLNEIVNKPVIHKLIGFNALDAIFLYDLGRITDRLILKGNVNAESRCFEFDIHSMHSDGFGKKT